MPDLATQAAPAVQSLLGESEDELYLKLAQRMRAMQRNPAVAGSFDPQLPQLESLGALEDLRTFGASFFARASRDAYQLVCGDAAEDSEERQRIISAFNIGKDAVAGALAAGLIAYLGFAPAIAAVVAALVIRLFYDNAHAATCDLWKTKVEAPTG
jgi:hypothetical protein